MHQNRRNASIDHRELLLTAGQSDEYIDNKDNNGRNRVSVATYRPQITDVF